MEVHVKTKKHRLLTGGLDCFSTASTALSIVPLHLFRDWEFPPHDRRRESPAQRSHSRPSQHQTFPHTRLVCVCGRAVPLDRAPLQCAGEGSPTCDACVALQEALDLPSMGLLLPSLPLPVAAVAAAVSVTTGVRCLPSAPGCVGPLGGGREGAAIAVPIVPMTGAIPPPPPPPGRHHHPVSPS